MQVGDYDKLQMTKNSYMLTHQVSKNNETFPLPILNKLRMLEKALGENGITDTLTICGSFVEIKTVDGPKKLYPKNEPGPWKNSLTFRSWSHIPSVVTAMSVVILLTQEGFYYSTNLVNMDSVGHSLTPDLEATALLSMAWGVVNSLGEIDNGTR